jgi:hypothetical protein
MTGRMKFDRYETSDVELHAYGESAVVTGGCSARV